jgi:hypothetical protein
MQDFALRQKSELGFRIYVGYTFTLLPALYGYEKK